MVDDISTKVKLAVTLTMLSVLISTTTMLSTIAFYQFNAYMDKWTIDYYSTGPELLGTIRNLQSVNGANAYKLTSMYEGYVNTLTISYLKPGDVYETIYDKDKFLEFAAREFKVVISPVGANLYNFVFTEVK